MGADIIEHETGKFSQAVFVKGGSANPFILKGKVTTATDATHFASTELIGYGNDAFNGWEVYVFYDGAGTGAAPQSEHKPISDYVSATGTFTHTAFTADLAVDDVVLILHPYESTGGDATEAKQDTIITDIGVVDGLIDVPAKDATTDAYMREVVGKKDDTAQTTVGTTRSIIAYMKGLLNQVAAILVNQSGEETVSSYNLPNDVAENTAITVTTTKRLRIDSVWLDFSNLVQDVTIKVYHKIDGSTYRQYDSFSWSTTEEDGILLRNITTNGDWKLTVTSTVAQGAIKSIPYNVIKTMMEA